MDIRTWQEADRAADDPYHPRHRSGRSPFRSWRPGPIAVGSLSTAAVAAFAFAAPGVLHVRTMPVDTRIDIAANHIGLQYPGADRAPSDPATSAAGVQAGTTPAPTTQPGPAQPTTGSQGTSGGSVKSADAHGTSGQSGTQSGSKHSGSGGSNSSNGKSGHSGSPTSNTGDDGDSDNSGDWWDGGSWWGSGTSGTSGSSGSNTTSGPNGSSGANGSSGSSGSKTHFNAASATAAAIREIDAARRSAHLGALRVDVPLTHAAIVHTSDMVVNGTFSHRGTDGSDPYGRAMRAGCLTFAKEIIARGNSGDDVIRSLLHDPSSYRALTSPGTHEIGIAAQQDPRTGQIIWTIELGWG